MFTGIVERTATAVAVDSTADGRRFRFVVGEGDGLPPWESVLIGESISISGICLTVVASAGLHVEFDVVPETLSRTRLGALSVGDRVNVERSLRVGDRYGGHYVTGHIDGTGEIVEMSPEGDQVLFRIETEARLIAEMVTKGSVTVDGVSLTIVEVERRDEWFSFAAIPHTLDVTALGRSTVGDSVNLETDAFGKWVLHGLREYGIDTPTAED